MFGNRFRVISIIPIILIIFCAFLYHIQTSQVSGLEIIGNNKGLSISHNEPLFNMEKMVPGEASTAVVTIKNESNAPFSVSLNSKKTNGDDQLFQALMITVKDDNTIYYHGGLKELKNINLKPISSNKNENYTLHVLFPADLGNEYQKKSVTVTFIFSTNRIDDVNANQGNSQSTGTGEKTTALIIAVMISTGLLGIIIYSSKVKRYRHTDF
ncbi:MAG TPA: hypothetical protein DEP23_12200 [Ruminococcaceae bacterium]|nr:hypothetical protein [Oscillospiraceae bacterium]